MNKLIQVITIVSLLQSVSCSSKKIAQEKIAAFDYPEKGNNPLVLEEGVYVERFNNHKRELQFNEAQVNAFNAALIHPEIHNSNNKIFTVGSTFRFRYQFFDKENNPLYFNIQEGGWDYVRESSSQIPCIKEVGLEVLKGRTNGNQTVIRYSYYGDRLPSPTTVNSITGVIENEMNVWLHPPRHFLFGVLELNPFPFIQQPYKVGHKWNWDLSIGSQWSDKRWAVWNGNLANHYTYEITDVKEMDTYLGKLTCYVIDSYAENELGKTRLTSYFDEQFGFVKLSYVNIDGSRLILDLSERRVK